MTVLGLIPARGGSRGLPRKNVLPLGGKPLLAWTLEAALACPALDRVVVSTDDPEIADVARGCGVEVPFLRPAELAADDVDDLPVFRHAVGELADDSLDVVVWLRPTVPLRTVEDIDGALGALRESGADAVRSVCLAEQHPYWMKRLEGVWLRPFVEGKDESTHARRQLLPPVYRLNGAVDVIRTGAVERNDSLFGGSVAGYVMPVERSVDIDTELDLQLVMTLVERRR